MRPTLNCLMLSDYDGRDANVIRDFLFSFNAYSRNRWYYVHDCAILPTLRFDPFDVIVMFWSYYWPGQGFAPEVAERIASAPALKVMFLQDEYRVVRQANEAMRRLGVQVMCTCVRPAEYEVFYPKSLIPTLRETHTVLTGYVPEYLRRVPAPKREEKVIDLGYRSRAVPLYLGDLGQEKSEIAHRFQKIAEAHGLSANISVREQDRLYGRAWLEFLRSCRCSLGTESGASVVDFTGDIERRCRDYVRANPGAGYDEVKRLFFAEVDGKVAVKAISPRAFECTAYRSTLVLHEGDYSGILRPHEHYIEVKKDYSNVDEVVAKIQDRTFCERLAETAYRDLIADDRYSYRAFVSWFDQMVASHVEKPVRCVDRSLFGFYLENYWTCNQGIIPIGSSAVKVPAVAGHVRGAKKALLHPWPRLAQAGSLLFEHAAGRGWQVVQRCLGRAAGSAAQNGELLRRCLGVAVLIARFALTNLGFVLLCLRCLARNSARPSLRNIARELHRLAILADARRGRVFEGKSPVRVDVPDRLPLAPEQPGTPRRTGGGHTDAARPAGTVRSELILAIEPGGEMIWDHTALGTAKTYWCGIGVWTHLPPHATYQFTLLPVLLRENRIQAERALERLLETPEYSGPGSAHVNSRQAVA